MAFPNRKGVAVALPNSTFIWVTIYLLVLFVLTIPVLLLASSTLLDEHPNAPTTLATFVMMVPLFGAYGLLIVPTLLSPAMKVGARVRVIVASRTFWWLAALHIVLLSAGAASVWGNILVLIVLTTAAVTLSIFATPSLWRAAMHARARPLLAGFDSAQIAESSRSGRTSTPGLTSRQPWETSKTHWSPMRMRI